MQTNKIIRVNHKIKWDDNEKVTVLLRYKNGKTIHTSKVKLITIYKLGVEYEPTYYKNGTVKGMKAVGYIINNEYHKITNLQFAYIKKLRKKIREYGSMMMIKEETVSVVDSKNRLIERKNKEYLCKWKKNDKFETVKDNVVKKRTDRNKS